MKQIQLTQCVIRTLLNIHDGFFRKQLTTWYFHEKFISQIFDMVLNAEAVSQKGFVKSSGPKNFEKFTGENL